MSSGHRSNALWQIAKPQETTENPQVTTKQPRRNCYKSGMQRPRQVLML